MQVPAAQQEGAAFYGVYPYPKQATKAQRAWVSLFAYVRKTKGLERPSEVVWLTYAQALNRPPCAKMLCTAFAYAPLKVGTKPASAHEAVQVEQLHPPPVAATHPEAGLMHPAATQASAYL